MDDNSLGPGMRRLVSRCVEEAARLGTNVVEAEHVLLALAADTATTLSRTLAGAGVTYDQVLVALQSERLRSLAVAGVVPPAEDMLTAARRTVKPRWGTSVVAARGRERRFALGLARRRRRPEIAMLMGILDAEIGTLPRALALAGVDRVALRARVAEL